MSLHPWRCVPIVVVAALRRAAGTFCVSRSSPHRVFGFKPDNRSDAIVRVSRFQTRSGCVCGPSLDQLNAFVPRDRPGYRVW
jgi:hypothetical protein